MNPGHGEARREAGIGTDQMVGQTIGNYTISSLLGKGGMGTVYLAEHPRIGRKVAVKIMDAAFTRRPQAAERFEGEARLITRVAHPGVIEIYDYGSLEDGSLYYIMELLVGRELASVMVAEGKLSPEQVLPYLEQICAALQAAHDHGVIHRDLKPENIFVLGQEPMTLKILDFGIAKLLEEEGGGGLTHTGMVMGTPLYIAPEQAAGQPDRISPRTDIYSLGVILYAMLAGRTPFIENAVGLLISRHINDEPPALADLEPTVPEAVAGLVHRCMAKQPEDRPQSARSVVDAYRAALTGGVEDPALSDTMAGAPPEAPIPETVAPTSESSHQPVQTTLGASAAQIAAGPLTVEAAPRSPALKLVGLAVAVAVVAVLAAVGLMSGGEPERVSAGAGLAPEEPEKAAPDAGALEDPAAAPTPDMAVVKPDTRAAPAARPTQKKPRARPAKPRPRPAPPVKPAPPPAAAPQPPAPGEEDVF